MLLPGLDHLINALSEKEKAFADIVKIGRTHTQDATPADARPGVFGLCRGADLWPPAAWSKACTTSTPWRRAAPRWAPASTHLSASTPAFAARVAELTDLPFRTAENKFEALASHGALT